MATKKDKEEAAPDMGKPFRPVYVGVPDVVSDAELETLKTDPRWPSIEAVATERHKEWRKAGGKKADDEAALAQAERDHELQAALGTLPANLEGEVSSNG